jgi:chemotaxis protein methyltransferase CheR
LEPASYRKLTTASVALGLPERPPIIDHDDASALAEAIVATIRDPLLVLDQNLRVVAANHAFYRTFSTSRPDIRGRLVYGLDDGQWDMPALRQLLEGVGSRHAVMEPYEVEQYLPLVGRRSLLMSAREVFNQGNARKLILLAIEDVTDRCAAEQAMAKLLQQKEILLQEMQHRVANTLQIIASILLLKARTVQSEETRLHLRDAHDRVMSVATVQQQLQASGHSEQIELGPYLSRLCGALAASMIGDSRPLTLKVESDVAMAISGDAVNIGLIITELVINALKHGFPDGRGGEILVSYKVDQANWRLSVSDSGLGSQLTSGRRGSTGLGTSIVEALAHQLKARVEISDLSPGTIVSIVHAA